MASDGKNKNKCNAYCAAKQREKNKLRRLLRSCKTRYGYSAALFQLKHVQVCYKKLVTFLGEGDTKAILASMKFKPL